MVDDDMKLCRLVRDYLQPLGFEVATAHSGPEGLSRATGEQFQAIILDLMLPGLGGYEVLRRLRMQSNVPVLMLTGMGEEADRIVGLELGADDYLPKTFSTRELLARLRAVLRRAAAGEPATGAASDAPLLVGELCVSPSARTALLAGRQLTLTRVEFELLAALARGCGRVQSREQLLDAIGSGRGLDVFDRSVDVHIASIRKKMGPEPRHTRYIETVRGVGYVMRWPETTAPQ
ncbi:MAG: response regulator transcription factor [Bryobacterales bacterium]|nr:response regulator transcription factor [Bryobacterales bacterium]